MAFTKPEEYPSREGNHRALYRNWWVVLFVVACSVVYFNSVGKKHELLATLDQRLEMLLVDRNTLLQVQDDLLLQINSQSDPAWVQLTLMKGLGLVPEGQLKVYFHNDGAPESPENGNSRWQSDSGL